jgi:hypothetical protein
MTQAMTASFFMSFLLGDSSFGFIRKAFYALLQRKSVRK